LLSPPIAFKRRAHRLQVPFNSIARPVKPLALASLNLPAGDGAT